MSKINSFTDRGIYTDLLYKFYEEGHQVYAVCPVERRERKSTHLKVTKEGAILSVKTFNLQKTNLIEKGIGTLAMEYQFLSSIKKNLSNVKFDLVLYSTPPITFTKVIRFVKKRDGAYSYLLLKDIFPQNAVDMKMLKENSFLHLFFKKKEKALYAISDTIGCMSEANKEYVIAHNATIDCTKIEVNPNSIKPFKFQQTQKQKEVIRERYQLPISTKILVYGGNLGVPQGLDFLLQIIEATTNLEVFYLIVGSGTEFERINTWFKKKEPQNAKLLAGLPKSDYDCLLNACDVGLIFLHKDFTIPNFPSRFLSYLEMNMPVIAATDSNTDIGTIIEENQCGFKVLSGDIEAVKHCIKKLTSDNLTFRMMQINAAKLLEQQYKVERSYNLIKDKINV